MPRCSPPTAPFLVTLGDDRRQEFAEVRWQIPVCWPHSRVEHWPSIPEFLAADVRETPDIILVWQSWPDEYPADQVLDLLARSPLATVLCVYGSWCESDGRTRAHWPPAMRVPVWQAGMRLQREAAARRVTADTAASMSTSTYPSLPLPWTASREEVWLRDHQHPAMDDALAGVTCAIHSSDRAYRQMLAELLQSYGAHVNRWNPAATPPEFSHTLLVDLDPFTAAQRALLEQLSQSDDEPPIVGLSSWIDPDFVADCTAIGVTAIVPKLDPRSLIETLVDLTAEPVE